MNLTQAPTTTPLERTVKAQAFQNGGVGAASAPQAPDSISTVLPRVLSLAEVVREYTAKHANSLRGQPPAIFEPTPMRGGVVGSLQDIEDVLRATCSYLDEIQVTLNG